MATDLFHNYYDDPKKSYIYTNLTCNIGDASEISFDINQSEGQITNNDKVLNSIDLSDIHVGLAQYTTDMKILEPHKYLYIKGMNYGETYSQKAFGRIYDEMTKTEGWMNNVILFFVIKYVDKTTGKRTVKSLKLTATASETFIDVLNTYFIDNNIPITASYDDGYIYFNSTEIGYPFWIDHVMLWKKSTDVDILAIINQWILDNGYNYKFGWDDEYIEANNVATSNPYFSKNVYSSVIKKSDYSRLYNLLNCLGTDFNDILEENNVQKVHLFEDLTKYIGPKKYMNGAMLGFVVKVTYPVYNADDIYDYQKSVRFAHLLDRIQEFYAIPESLFKGTFVGVRKLIDVVDTYHSEYDENLYNSWLGGYSHINGGDDWIDADEVPQVVPEMFNEWENSSVSYDLQAMSIYKDIEDREAMGLEGFCAYMSKTKNWNNMGQFYARTVIPDDDSVECRNLIPSFVIYNPNDFPVTVNYMTFGE